MRGHRKQNYREHLLKSDMQSIPSVTVTLTHRILVARVNSGEDAFTVWRDVADHVAACMAERRDTFEYWEKYHFQQAIELLAESILPLCLTMVQKALYLPDQRPEGQTIDPESVESLTYEDLMLRLLKMRPRA